VVPIAIGIKILNFSAAGKNYFGGQVEFVSGSRAGRPRQPGDSLTFDLKPRYYLVQPCFCPEDGTIRINSREYDPNNPYGEYKDQKPIVLRPGNSTWLKYMLREGRVVRKDTVPVL